MSAILCTKQKRMYEIHTVFGFGIIKQCRMQIRYHIYKAAKSFKTGKE